MSLNELIFETAKADEGTFEWKGAENNPKVVKYFEDAGHGHIKTDSTPWCAAFVGSVLAKCGLQGTGSLAARSYLKWGVAVDLDDAQQGDIVVFWRGAPDGWQGHVGFYAGRNGDKIRVLGGNQRDQVNISGYGVDRLLGVRRAKLPRAKPTETKTAKASTAQIVAGASGVGTAIAALDGQAQLVAIAGGFLLLGFGLWFFRNRLKDFASGAR
jgi:uncharacterized protein (TIGR02594 family)